MTVDKDRLFKKLDHVGEHVVRENLENGVYGENRRPFVEEWLEQFDEPEELEAAAHDPDTYEVRELDLEDVPDEFRAQADEPRAEPAVVSEAPWYRRAAGVITVILGVAIALGALLLFG